MFVEKLVIDGFKSYQQRTVVEGWDESFNCITGLNGSGKSNILDAICFVLGNTRLREVRAHNLQDLIYKRGKAGVTKASVTIIFNNRDKSKSPLDYKKHDTISVTRQVVLGGTSKYLLNGTRAQQDQVKRFFQSVQLNIDNPSFMIMQGRITKVLNMKAKEVLALVEEAAGTREFEARRANAIKSFEKRQAQVEYNQSMLREEIEPKLDRLRKEKRDYLEMQACQTTVEAAEKLVVSHDFVEASKLKNELDSELVQGKAQCGEHENSLFFLESQLNEYKELRARRIEEQQQLGGADPKLKADLEAAMAEQAKLQTEKKLRDESLEEEREKYNETTKKLEKCRGELAKFKESNAQFKGEYEKEEARCEEAKTYAANKRNLLSSLETGISAKGQRETGYSSEAKRIRNEISSNYTQVCEQERLRDEVAKRIKDNESDTNMDRVANLRQQIETGNAEITRLENQRQDHSDVALDDLKSRKNELEYQISTTSKDLDVILRKYPFLNLDVPQNLKNSVKGFVAHVISLPDNQRNKAVALEVCAGGRLFNIIVDNSANAQRLLESGMKQRVTVLPLDKIKGGTLPDARLQAAKEAAPGNVDLALHLLNYDQECRAAVEYVFGRTLVCKDAATSNLVTFLKSVMSQSVTWDGDIYRPNGTLSGGARRSNSLSLNTVQQYNTLRGKLQELRSELAEVIKQLSSCESKAQKTADLAHQIDLASHKLSLLKLELAQAESAGKDIESLKEALETHHQSIKALGDSSAKLRQELQKVENDAAKFDQNKDEQLRELRAEVEQAESQANELKNQLALHEDKFNEVVGTIEQLEQEIELAQDRSLRSETSITELKQSLQGLEVELKQATSKLNSLESAVEKERSRLLAMDSEIEELNKSIKTTSSLYSEEKVALQQLTHSLDTSEKKLHVACNTVNELSTKYPWLSRDRELLGVPDTPYYYQGANISHQRGVLKTESTRLQSLVGKVNSEVLSMIESYEKREETLKHKINELRRDKQKMESTLESIDEHKDRALDKTWKQVSDDLGRIFNSLLPESSAKLVPIDANDISCGLEIEVCLGGVWKEGLGELSGGQRSLVALSLILSLLQYRPAPMYILDEVDAALDLQHTQNIGYIIGSRFKGSQFIIVSLKEGMFSNARRIYKTRFQDGTSKVSIIR